jgi:Glycosyltransferase family 87
MSRLGRAADLNTATVQPPPDRTRSALVNLSGQAIVVLIAVRIIAVVLIALKAGPTEAQGHGLGVDTPIYQEIVTNPGRPYRDFEVEYPPLTLAELEAVHGSNSTTTGSRLAWAQLVLDCVTIAALWWAWGRLAAGAYLVLTLPFVGIIYLQVDPLVVALAVGGLALVERGYHKAGGIIVALAAFAKIWPILLIPVLAARRKWSSVWAALAMGAAGVIAWVIWAGPSAPLQIMRLRGLDGWEIGSGWGSLLRLVAHDRIRWVGYINRVGFEPAWLRSLLFGMALLGALLAARAARYSDWPESVLVGLVLLLLLSPKFSGQYALWLAPFAAISFHRRTQWLALVAIALCASTVWYVSATVPEAKTLDWWLVLKNLAVLALGIQALHVLLTVRPQVSVQAPPGETQAPNDALFRGGVPAMGSDQSH